MRRVLIDKCINPRLAARLRDLIPQHSIATVHELGWAGQRDHALVLEIQGRFDVFVTLDKGFEFEQNLKALSFGVIVLETDNNQMPSYERVIGELVSVIQSVAPGEAARVKDSKR